MAVFDFSNAKTSVITRLQPWTINKVTFKGTEIKTGKTKDGNDWKAIQFKFSGEKGIFEPMIFCPKDEKGVERFSGKTGDREWEMPSQAEQLFLTIAHVISTLSPTAWSKFPQKWDLPKDVDKLLNTTVAALKSSIGKETNIKLIGDSKNYASIPNFISCRPGEAATIYNNWLGENLAFTNGELNKKKKVESTKPTKVEEMENNPDENKDNEDIDWDNI